MKHNNLKSSVILIAFPAEFTPFVVHAEGVIQLPKTGQTKCYDTVGTEISCAGTGQDAEMQAWVTWPNREFTNQYLGNNDWRLTNRKELRSLVDYSKYNPFFSYRTSI